MRSPTTRLVSGVLAGGLLAGCAVSTAPGGAAADLRGTWRYAGTQAAPALQLTGTLVITGQTDDAIVGTLSWTETDGVTEPVLRGGPVSGTVIGMEDVDFDVAPTDGVRRHVARVTPDSLVGVWVSTGSSKSGTFTAVRQVSP